MNAFSFRTLRGHLLREVIASLLFYGMLLQSATAVAPNWWATRSVLAPGVAADDYAVANQGQLKNLANKAALEMGNHLPGGAGAEINAMITAWSTPTPATDDYAALNQGQLKSVAQMFYDRLAAVGAGTAGVYPWSNTGLVADDYAVANQGQLKNAFAFDIPQLDANHNGIPDAWELQMFGNLDQYPDDDFDFDGVTNLEEWQAGTLAYSYDTDGDGWSDWTELHYGGDPRQSNRSPSGAVVATFGSYDTDSFLADDGWLVTETTNASNPDYRWQTSHTWYYLEPPGGHWLDAHQPTQPDTPLRTLPTREQMAAYWHTEAVGSWRWDAYDANNLGPNDFVPNGAYFPIINRWDKTEDLGNQNWQELGWGLNWKRYRLRLPAALSEDYEETYLKVTYQWDKANAVWHPYDYWDIWSYGYWTYPAPTIKTTEVVKMELKKGQTEGDWLYVMSTTAENEMLSVHLTALSVAIVPDFNRDGVINDEDRNRITSSDPYRFWINNDKDDDEVAEVAADGSDDPDAEQAQNGDAEDDRVLSSRDLIDWFPLYFDIKPLLDAMPPADYDYKIAHATGAVNFMPCDSMEAYATDEYLCAHAYQRVQHVSQRCIKRGDEQRTDDSGGAPVNWVSHTTADGTKLTLEWLEGVKNKKEAAIILFEGRKASTEPLTLTVTPKNGGDTYSMRFDLSISKTKDMYRWINLRAAGGHETGDPTNTSPPPNWKDEWCGKKALVFVHGYNVNADAARAWGAEMWKRFYWSGSNAKFHMVTWRGDHGQLPFNKTPDYWINVYNAFLTAPALKDEVGKIKDEVYIAGHSLGNMVISSAMADHGMKVKRYYMINAAVPCEAYDPSARQRNAGAMTHTDWRGQATDLQAARYARLYAGDADNRKYLTWQGRFSKMDKSKVYQLYSTGEDVLEPNDDSEMPSLLEVVMTKHRAWVGQETSKGLLDKQLAQWVASLVSHNQPYEGHEVLAGGWSWRLPQWSEPPTTNADKKSNPVFKPFNRAMNGESVHGVRGSLLLEGWNKSGTHGYSYMASLLAQDVPALSWPAGSVVVPLFNSRRDLMTLMSNNTWPKKSQPDAQQRVYRWLHSDLHKVSYLNTYPLFELIVNDGLLKQ